MCKKAEYNLDVLHRRSIRLYGYDYSCDGLYFITICCRNRMCLFGKIINDEMVLNDAGRMAEQEWANTMSVRSGDVVLHDFVIMPNHMHAIIEITHSFVAQSLHATLRSPSQTLGAIVRGYKSAVSRQLGSSVWQRNYYEHIIRNSKSYGKIAEYIMNNPANWRGDDLYVDSSEDYRGL